MNIKNAYKAISEQGKIVLFALLLIVTLEILSALPGGSATRLAAHLWLLGFLITYATIIWYYAKTAISNFKKKRYLFLIIQNFIILILILPIGNPNIFDLNYESGLQVSGGISALTSQDLNYHGTAFLGYGARQYIINAIPSILFGRSLWSLNFGFASIFIMGFIAFSTGLSEITDKLKKPHILAILPCIGIFCIKNVPEYYLVAEQTLNPASFTLIIIGLVLILSRKWHSSLLYSIAWTLCIMVYTYPPALSFVALAILIGGISVAHPPNTISYPSKREYRIITLSIISATVIQILISTLAKNGRADRTDQMSLENFFPAFNSIWDYIYGSETLSLGFGGVLGILFIPIMFFLVKSICTKNGKYAFIITIWTIATLLACVLFRGSSIHNPAYALSFRSIHIFAVLIPTIYLITIKNTNKLTNKKHVLIAFLIMATSISANIFEGRKYYTISPQRMKFIVSDMTKEIKQSDKKYSSKIVFFTRPGGNFHDYQKYFFPESDVSIVIDGNIPEEGLKNTISYADTYGMEIIKQKLDYKTRKHLDIRSRQKIIYYRINSQD